MKLRITIIAALALAVATTGCKKDPPATPGPGGGTSGPADEPGPAPTTAGEAPSATAGEQPAGTDGAEDPATTGGALGGETGGGEAAATTDSGTVDSGETTPPPRDRLEAPIAAEVPTDNLLMVVQRASTSCPANQPLCPARDALSAKLATDIESTAELLEKGTDQQKVALRAALLRARSPEADALLVTGLIGPGGMLDDAVIEHALELRAEAMVEPLSAFLQRAVGPDAVKAINALSRIAHDGSREQLSKALDDQRLKPWHGEVCRALSRVGVTDRGEKIVEIGAHLAATDRQRIGCRTAEAVLRMLKSAANPVYMLQNQRRPPTALLLHHPVKDPLHVVLSIHTNEGASCAAPGAPSAQLQIPLDRNTDPIVGVPVVPVLFQEGRHLGRDGVFLFQLDALEMKANTPAQGIAYVSHTTPNEPRVLFTGRFDATYCGVGR